MLRTRRRRRAIAIALAIAASTLVACGSDDEPAPAAGGEEAPPPAAGDDEGPQHVHGLGIDPADGALLIATHTGLYRSAPDEREAARVGDVRHDLMGFTVVGEGTYLASGHPDLRDGGPANLGLVRSEDGGESWETVSLGGIADFHVLRVAGERIYGYDSVGGRLLASLDGGASWEELRTPEGLIDLVASPDDPLVLVCATATGLLGSEDGGRTWESLGQPEPGLMAWMDDGRLVRVGVDGRVDASADGGRSWRSVGALGAPPAALAAEDGQLYAATQHNAVLESGDGGESWRVRVEP